jgi:hypothetical protein
LPWAALVALNLEHGSAIPWAVPPTALYLWFFWRYVRGAWGPRSTADARRELARAHRLSEDVWGAALLAGGLGLVTLVLLLGVVNRLVVLPAQRTEELAHVPVLTASGSSGRDRRRYRRGIGVPRLHGTDERRHGPVVALL